VRGDTGADRGDRAGQQGRAEDDHDSSATTSGRVVAAAGLDGDVHAQ
jgi:hypothetical protein